MTLFFAMLLPAADVTGTWKGSFESGGKTVSVTLEMKAIDDGVVIGALRGLGTPDPDIRDGQIDGNALSFFINYEEEGQQARLVGKGTVSSDEIDLDLRMDTGSWGAHVILKKP